MDVFIQADMCDECARGDGDVSERAHDRERFLFRLRLRSMPPPPFAPLVCGVYMCVMMIERVRCVFLYCFIASSETFKWDNYPSVSSFAN